MIDSLPRDTAEIETRMAEKSGPGTRRTDDKNLVWFGIEKKLENMQTGVETPTGNTIWLRNGFQRT
jgi:hypothetical protein